MPVEAFPGDVGFGTQSADGDLIVVLPPNHIQKVLDNVAEQL